MAAKITSRTRATVVPRSRLRELDPGRWPPLSVWGRASGIRDICSFGSGGTGESGTASGEVGLTGAVSGTGGAADRPGAAVAAVEIGAKESVEEETAEGALDEVVELAIEDAGRI